MKNFRQWTIFLPVITGTVLLLMGASNQVKSSATNSTTNTVSTSVATGLTSTQMSLSPSDEEIARIVKFDRKIMLIVKGETHERFCRLIGYDEKGYQIITAGIAVAVPEDKTDSTLLSLRRKLRPLQYMAFVVETNMGIKIDKIGILKGTDQYEIIRIMHTDGDDYDISNQDVIDRLKEWEKIASFDVIGAESDWVELEFKTLPKDLKSFTEEVYDFCPDAVEQGPGSVEGLIKEIKKTNRLFLWWD